MTGRRAVVLVALSAVLVIGSASAYLCGSAAVAVGLVALAAYLAGKGWTAGQLERARAHLERAERSRRRVLGALPWCSAEELAALDDAEKLVRLLGETPQTWREGKFR